MKEPSQIEIVNSPEPKPRKLKYGTVSFEQTLRHIKLSYFAKRHGVSLCCYQRSAFLIGSDRDALSKLAPIRAAASFGVQEHLSSADPQ